MHMIAPSNSSLAYPDKPLQVLLNPLEDLQLRPIGIISPFGVAAAMNDVVHICRQHFTSGGSHYTSPGLGHVLSLI